ncbi:MAG TPA: TonB-dependent receptor [Parapedobacter sp.]|uniref:SusC/RagA family TonB-linked outer membrane protein n=1 Tax=Parapedobacter sp. TaxID=1958893 RepID=UPI002BE84CF3|nr:TonB-dependent receptor [Parapedobacter sp.]HWK57156.1 TonB-dependent receptor [Parapedobacter sp.]
MSAIVGVPSSYDPPGNPIPPIQIKGKVVDSEGNPLQGVSVNVVGTTVGSTTNSEGFYVISIVDNSSVVLEFSSVGFQRKSVTVGTQTEINVTLEEDVAGLEEVVVVGYGTQKKLTVTGAISSVGSADLIKSPNASVANTLAGRVTGLATVQYSGRPGGDDPITYIRGIGSLTSAASAPLTLVDGVERPFTQLDPNEIESVSVLKDASATAVFGVRGANGVIIVTTKRGTEGPAKISVSASAGLQQPLRLPVFVDSYTHAKMYTEAQQNDDPNAVLKFSPEALEAFRTNSDPIIYPNTDWVNYILKPSAFQTQENVNISGGTKAVRYFVSLGYLKQDGLFRIFDLPDNNNYSYNRYNYRVNLDIDVTKTTTLSLTTGGRSEFRNEPLADEPQFSIWRNIYFAQPYRGIGIVDGKHIQSDPRYISGETRDALNGYYGKGFQNALTNPLNFDLMLNQQLDALVKGLSFKVKGSYNGSYSFTKIRNSSRATYLASYLHDLDPTEPDDKTVVYRKIGEDGTLGYAERYDKARDWYFETAFSYDRMFEAHRVTGLLLYNQSKTFYPTSNVDIPRGYVGLVGRITYDYQSKYLLDLNMGYNGSENFAPERRFGLFPAISAGWVVSEEKFMKAYAPFIEYLKIRGSYGVVGNDRMGNSRFLYLPDSYSANSGGYSFGVNVPQNQIGASEGKVGNPLVTWEKSKKKDIGLDLTMLNGKIAVVADYFTEHRDNILTTRQTVPGILAINLPAVNIGVVDNHGYELQIKWRDNIGAFNYMISPNMSFARNKIVFMDETPQRESYLLRTGNRVNQPFGYVFDGFWTETDVANIGNFPNANYEAKPGDLRYKDLNGDGQINVDDQRPIGFPDYPEYVFGLTIEMQYKGFDLHMMWSGATNVSRAFQGSFQLPFGPTHGFGLMKYMADGRWTPETAASATYPRMTFLGIENNMKYSDYWLKDASYARLKNVELGYSFDAAKHILLKRLGMSSLRLYANGYNLLTFDNLGLIDPESVPTENAQYPLMRIFNFGLNVTF